MNAQQTASMSQGKQQTANSIKWCTKGWNQFLVENVQLTNYIHLIYIVLSTSHNAKAKFFVASTSHLSHSSCDTCSAALELCKRDCSSSSNHYSDAREGCFSNLNSLKEEPWRKLDLALPILPNMVPSHNSLCCDGTFASCPVRFLTSFNIPFCWFDWAFGTQVMKSKNHEVTLSLFLEVSFMGVGSFSCGCLSFLLCIFWPVLLSVWFEICAWCTFRFLSMACFELLVAAGASSACLWSRKTLHH